MEDEKTLHARAYLEGLHNVQKGFPGGTNGEESACNTGDPGSIPGSGGSPEEGNCNHSSILAWRIPRTEEPSRLYSIWVANSWTRLSD